MPSTPVVIAVAMLLMLILLLFFTAIVIAIVALTSWFLTLITSLSFSQAALIAGAASILVIYLSRRELFVSVPATFMLVLIISPFATLVFVAVAWGLDRFSPLDFWQATLLTTGVGLAVLYGLVLYLAESPFGDGVGEDWEDEEWENEEWDEDDEEEEYDDEAKWMNVGRNDPCPCGSGKKYKYCHGQKNN
jgi:hypothetical protein